MDCEFSCALKIVSAVVLAFFLWTFWGVVDIVYALNTGSKFNVQGFTLKTGQTRTQKPEEKFEKDIAAELGNSLVNICEYVHNSFSCEPYYGSIKGANQTLLEKAGNDIDLASVLIALLRATVFLRNTPVAQIELSTNRLMNWLGGVRDPRTAAQIIDLAPAALYFSSV
ncbi:MAG: hypothetical protein M1497_14215 [Nitrospirae bacterium]|nr:hypothetical protein [Nitrospirota bacterium]